MTSASVAIAPGRGLGWITLGSSLHSVISRIKSQPETYPKIDLSYSSSHPVLQPVILSLPANGLRLRFDGPNQQLRLIEVLDFAKTALTYKGIDLVKPARSIDDAPRQDVNSANPTFRHIYNRLFGPAYEGEYTPPDHGRRTGTYALSYPGLAFLFPVDHKSWSDKADFVSMLSSTATGPATSMAIFAGSSWPEARTALFENDVHVPSHAQAEQSTDLNPIEIDEVIVYGAGRLELRRRSGTLTSVQLGSTTPQDLVAEFGPPDAIYRKNDNKISIHAAQRPSSRRGSSVSPALDAVDADRSSMQSYSETSETESLDHAPESLATSVECFYNYFHHGFDALISYSKASSPAFPGDTAYQAEDLEMAQPVVTKLMLHGNVPGSYCFNRHQRCRWTIRTPMAGSVLSSEMPFSEVSKQLKQLWHQSYADSQEEKQMQRGMVLNRGWGESPDSSIEILGGFEESAPRNQEQTSIMNNTELFGFPGMLFEVLKNDAISCLTVC